MARLIEGLTEPAQSFTLLEAVEIVEDMEGSERYYAAWQWLHTTGHAYRLQGWYGRKAQHYLRMGLIK